MAFDAETFTDDTGIALETRGRYVFSIVLSAMGAATAVDVHFSNDDGSTYAADTNLSMTAARTVVFEAGAFTHVKTVGTGGTDYTAKLARQKIG